MYFEPHRDLPHIYLRVGFFDQIYARLANFLRLVRSDICSISLSFLTMCRANFKLPTLPSVTLSAKIYHPLSKPMRGGRKGKERKEREGKESERERGRERERERKRKEREREREGKGRKGKARKGKGKEAHNV